MSRWMRVAAAGLLAGSIGAAACNREGQPPAPGSDATIGHADDSVARLVEAEEPPPFVSRGRDGRRLWDLTKQFYQKRENRPAWSRSRRPLRQVDDLIGALQRADREGLDPELYSVSMLTARRVEAGRGLLRTRGFEPDEAMELDVWLTYVYIAYATDLANGLSVAAHADPSWQIRDSVIDPVQMLEQALHDNHVAASLDDLTPRYRQYTDLREALARYRGIAERGGWPAVPAGLKLKPGEHSPAVPIVARRLAIEGDYTEASDAGTLDYGPALVHAVERFQRRHGLDPDGVIGPATTSRMNIPVERRLEQIALNLERWRWLPRDLGDRYVLVNVPEYRLEVWDHGQVPVSMRVVVGKTDTPTPIFSDRMTYLVFAPYWNIPADIATRETIPSVLEDPAFLRRTNMEAVDKTGTPVDPASLDLSRLEDYRFRQRPGGANSLGFVKFMFPNQFNVYLHDTPADSLFARVTRSFSHGCVRLEQPERLAEYVLADQPAWTPEGIQEAMHAGQERTVKLTAPLPVYLGYWTARVSADGVLQFRDDIYGIDARQADVLNSTLKALRERATAAQVRLAASND